MYTLTNTPEQTHKYLLKANKANIPLETLNSKPFFGERLLCLLAVVQLLGVPAALALNPKTRTLKRKTLHVKQGAWKK